MSGASASPLPSAPREGPPVHVRAAVDADEPEVLALLEAALGPGPTGRRSPAFFRWKHRRNPFGASQALVAEAPDGQVVGFRTLLRWRFRAGEQRIEAVRAVDTATHPQWQGRGVFSRLTAAAREQHRHDHDLIFNTPNARSLPGYRKLGWQVVGQVPVRLRPLRPLRLARGVRSARAADGAATPLSDWAWRPAREVLADRAATQDLLDAAAEDGRLRTDHDARSLAWRYADCPDLDYRALPARDRDGRLHGLAIGRLRARGGLRELALAEVLVRAGDARTARGLLRAAARSGADHVTTVMPPGSEAADQALRAGYVTAPAQGPILVANPLSDRLPLDPASLTSWRLTLGDLEVL